MNVIALIPARYASSRFPGKPLAMLGGKSVIERVCRQVAKAGIRPVVATDDSRILEHVKSAGFEAIMTGEHHKSGTDRIHEAYTKLPDREQADVIINVQGDEPFIRPEQLKALAEAFQDPEVEIATLVKRWPKERPYGELEDPNLVKAVRDGRGYALYFSRSVIPYIRGKEKPEWPQSADYYTHIGVYAFRPEALVKAATMQRAPLEIAESLEQLRWLSSGMRIMTVETSGSTIGIDTAADLDAAEKFLAEYKEND